MHCRRRAPGRRPGGAGSVQRCAGRGGVARGEARAAWTSERRVACVLHASRVRARSSGAAARRRAAARAGGCGHRPGARLRTLSPAARRAASIPPRERDRSHALGAAQQRRAAGANNAGLGDAASASRCGAPPALDGATRAGASDGAGRAGPAPSVAATAYADAAAAAAAAADADAAVVCPGHPQSRCWLRLRRRAVRCSARWRASPSGPSRAAQRPTARRPAAPTRRLGLTTARSCASCTRWRPQSARAARPCRAALRRCCAARRRGRRWTRRGQTWRMRFARARACAAPQRRARCAAALLHARHRHRHAGTGARAVAAGHHGHVTMRYLSLSRVHVAGRAAMCRMASDRTPRRSCAPPPRAAASSWEARIELPRAQMTTRH